MSITTPTHLQTAHYSSPQVTYTKLMKSSTRLHPFRQPYVPLRMVNDVYGKAINREIQDGYDKVNQMMDRRDQQRLRRWDSVRRQGLEMVCDRVYL